MRWSRCAPAAGWRPRGILDLLASLVDKSLVQAEEHGAKTRYRMLETIRAYARQKLSDAAEAALVRDQHLDYHLRLAESVEPHLFGAGFEQWLVPLELELDNFRGALAWALDAMRVDEALRLASALWLFFEACGHWREGRAHLEAALAEEGPGALPRAKALIAASHIATFATDWAAGGGSPRRRSRLDVSSVRSARWVARSIWSRGH